MRGYSMVNYQEPWCVYTNLSNVKNFEFRFVDCITWFNTSYDVSRNTEIIKVEICEWKLASLMKKGGSLAEVNV